MNATVERVRILRPLEEVCFESKPFTKQVGGKTRLVPTLLTALDGIDFDSRTNRFYEVFAGGAALFFALKSRGWLFGSKAILNEADPDLVRAMRFLQRSNVDARPLGRLFVSLERHSKRYALERCEHYYRTRDEWNAGVRTIDRFLFLRAASFNGLWRYSKSGEMNAPCAKYKRVRFDFDVLRRCAWQLHGAVITNSDFSKLRPRAGDLVYVDPPYHRTFVAYRPEGFPDARQVEVIRTCARWSDAGARVLYSNADTPEVRRWLRSEWSGSTVFRVASRWSVGADGASRVARFELLARAS